MIECDIDEEPELAVADTQDEEPALVDILKPSEGVKTSMDAEEISNPVEDILVEDQDVPEAPASSEFPTVRDICRLFFSISWVSRIMLQSRNLLLVRFF